VFLIHLTFESPVDGAPLPGDIARLIRSGATAEDGLEHVAVHVSARPFPVLGVFLRSPDMAAAEAAAERLWWRATAHHPWLGAWRLRRAEAPLLHPEAIYPEGMPPENGDEPGQGRA
jgi:hypothetical protein